MVYRYIHGKHVHVHIYVHAHVPTCTYVYMHDSYSGTVCQSQHEVKAIKVCQAFIMNSDERREARLRRRRERRATKALRRGRRN